MTQSEEQENGHKSGTEVKGPTFEPAYAPGDDTEPVGWVRIEPGEDEELVSDLLPELDLDEPEPPNPN